MKIPLFFINMDCDRDRLASLSQALSSYSCFDVTRVSGLPGSALPDTACFTLTRSDFWKEKKGAIGNFLSHVKVWEDVANRDSEFCLVLEDDARPRALHRFASAEGLAGYDLVFINERMSPGSTGDPLDQVVSCLPITAGLAVLNRTGRGAGTDGYALTPYGARKLLAATMRDLYFGYIDGRLLRYSVTPEILDADFAGTRVEHMIRHDHNANLAPAWGVLKSGCLNTPLVSAGGFPSRVTP